VRHHGVLLPSAVLLLAVAAAQAAFAPAAHAAATTRYASTTGLSTNDCLTAATACDLPTAFAALQNGDELIIAPGTYTSPTHLWSSAINLNVHGVAGQGRPVINAPGNPALGFLGGGTQVTDLTVNATSGSGIAVTISSRIERLQVRANDSFDDACVVDFSSSIRDSLCVASGADASAIVVDGGNATMENVTAVATGAGSHGLEVPNDYGGTYAVTLRNMILAGAASDINLTAPTGAGTVSVTATSSNYDSLTPATLPASESATAPGTGGNQTAAPVFTDAAFHEAASSPTIDKGTTVVDLGPYDLDGNARKLGSAPDIGVDEFVPQASPVPPRDTTAPDTGIDKAPKHKGYKRKATFAFHSTEAGSTFRCSVDGKPAVSCTSPFKVKVKPGRKHTFSVAAVDAAGNVDATPATYKWKVWWY
jgi:hypothetical protein